MIVQFAFCLALYNLMQVVRGPVAEAPPRGRVDADVP
jgi:hypothetical protein